MLAILLAAACAIAWGVADFSGGKAARGAPAMTVTVISQLLSLPILVACLLLVPGRPTLIDLGWGALAGVAGFAGIVLLYQALSAGAMAVTAPITAVTAALVPMAVGLITDRMPGQWAMIGAVIAVVAIGLVSLGPAGGRGAVTPRLVGMSLAAGAMFGLFTTLLGQSTGEAGMWSLLGVRVGSLGLGVLLLLRTRQAWRLPRTSLRWAAVAGPLDIAANAFLLAAATRGHLSIVAAIASLYPASTVLLALAVDRERLRPVQLAGLGLAATALVLATTA